MVLFYCLFFGTQLKLTSYYENAGCFNETRLGFTQTRLCKHCYGAYTRESHRE